MTVDDAGLRGVRYVGSPPHDVYVMAGDGTKRILEHHVHHSPSGFSWGYEGSGPAELARCILWDHIGEEPSPGAYQAFKLEYVATIPTDDRWSISSAEVQSWLDGYAERVQTAIEERA